MKVDDPNGPSGRILQRLKGQVDNPATSEVGKTQGVKDEIQKPTGSYAGQDDAVKISPVFKLVEDATEEVRRSANEVNVTRVKEVKKKLALERYDVKEVAAKLYNDYLK